jgi:hypothetical protein
MSVITFCQNESILFESNDLRIYADRAYFGDHELYNAETDINELKKREETEECKVDYTIYYNPLSLVGNYYSYEFGEGGIIACGVPGSSVSVQTMDISNNNKVSLVDLFFEKEIVQALQQDPWIRSICDTDSLEKIHSFKVLLDFIYESSQIQFSTYSFAFLNYDDRKNLLAVRFVGSEYLGYNHYSHFQLGLLLKPKESFRNMLLTQSEFFIGKFKNGLIK